LGTLQLCHETTARLLEQPSSEQKQQAQADETRGTAEFIHYRGEIEKKNRQSETGNAEIDPFLASFS